MTTSTPSAKPTVWQMPATGIEWCDCGEHHEVTRELILESIIITLGDAPEFLPHPQICEVIMDLWNYEDVCSFFHDHVKLSAEAINGSVQDRYPFETGVEIIAYFTKTWNGCPEEACKGGETT